MLPALTVRSRGRPPRRTLLAVGGALVLAAAVLLFGSALVGSPRAAPPPPPVAEALDPGTWAVSVPISWFAAPISGLRPGDRLDVLALRAGDRPTAKAVAMDLRVMAVDERTVVVGTGAEDATGLAVARASGLMLIPLLRSTR